MGVLVVSEGRTLVHEERCERRPRARLHGVPPAPPPGLCWENSAARSLIVVSLLAAQVLLVIPGRTAQRPNSEEQDGGGR